MNERLCNSVNLLQYNHNSRDYGDKKITRFGFNNEDVNDDDILFQPKMKHLRRLRVFKDGFIEKGGVTNSEARTYLVSNIRALKQENGAWQIRDLFNYGKQDGLFGSYNYAKFFKGVLKCSYGDNNIYVAERFYKITCEILEQFPIVEDYLIKYNPRYTEITEDNIYIQSSVNPGRIFKEVCRMQELMDKMTYYALPSGLGVIGYDYMRKSREVRMLLSQFGRKWPRQDFKALLQCLLMHYSELLPNGELRSPYIVNELLDDHVLQYSQAGWRDELIYAILARVNESTFTNKATVLVDRLFVHIINLKSTTAAARYIPQLISIFQKLILLLSDEPGYFNNAVIKKGVNLLIQHISAVDAELMPQIELIIQQLGTIDWGDSQRLALLLLDRYSAKLDF